MSKTSASLAVGNSVTLTATLSPSNATNKTVTYSTSSSTYATVSTSGKITAVKAGSATITAKTSNGKTATCSVTINAKPVLPTGIALDKNTLTLEIGDTYTFTPTVSPSNATDKTVTFTASGTSAILSKGGVITASKVGTTTIYAKTVNNYAATCTVNVIENSLGKPYIKMDKDYFDKFKLIYIKGFF